MLSILIVNWNTKSLLLLCLRSIRENPPKIPHEVVVVDNASSDGSADAVASEFPEVILVRSETNTGYAGGNNIAFQRATGDWLLTLNPDTEVYSDTLDRAVERLTANPEYGALGAKQIGVDGKVQRSVREFPSPAALLTGRYRLPDFDYEREGPAPQPMGTFLLFRRNALPDPVRPFDESFPIFFNEVDLLLRMRRVGWPCLYSPAVRIRHHGGESTRLVRKSMIWESHRSLVRFWFKHYRTVWSLPLLWIMSLAAFAGAFVRAKGYDAGFRA